MRVLLFETAHDDGLRRWAISVADIVEILPVVRWRPIIGGPPCALGLFERQQTLVPLIDLPMKLGAEPVTPRLGSRIVVVRVPITAGAHALLGLLVESMIGLSSIDFAGSGSHSGFDAQGDAPVGRVTTAEGTTVQLVRVEHVLSESERAAILVSCAGEATT